MTPKWLPGPHPRVNWDDPKVTQKWLKSVVRSHFWVTFGSLWGRSARVTFESLLGHFNPFWVSVDLGARWLPNARGYDGHSQWTLLNVRDRAALRGTNLFQPFRAHGTSEILEILTLAPGKWGRQGGRKNRLRLFLGGIRVSFWQRIFVVEPPDFITDFVALFFLTFLGKKVPRKILQENPRQNPPGKSPTKSSNFYTKIPHNFLQRGQAKR